MNRLNLNKLLDDDSFTSEQEKYIRSKVFGYKISRSKNNKHTVKISVNITEKSIHQTQIDLNQISHHKRRVYTNIIWILIRHTPSNVLNSSEITSLLDIEPSINGRIKINGKTYDHDIGRKWDRFNPQTLFKAFKIIMDGSVKRD